MTLYRGPQMTVISARLATQGKMSIASAESKRKGLLQQLQI